MSLTETRYSDSRRVQFDWTAERVVDLTRKWVDEKMTSSAIAAEYGVSRNTIVGKVGRLGLIGRKAVASAKKAAVRARRDMSRAEKAQAQEDKAEARAAAQRRVVAEMLVANDPLWIDEPTTYGPVYNVVDLQPEHCRWPTGEPKQPGFHFCGSPATHGSYCAQHHRMAYAPRGSANPNAMQIKTGWR